MLHIRSRIFDAFARAYSYCISYPALYYISGHTWPYPIYGSFRTPVPRKLPLSLILRTKDTSNVVQLYSWEYPKNLTMRIREKVIM